MNNLMERKGIILRVKDFFSILRLLLFKNGKYSSTCKIFIRYLLFKKQYDSS